MPTFGKTTIGGTTWTVVGGVAIKSWAVLPVDGKVTKLTAYLKNTSGAVYDVDVGIYNGNAQLGHLQKTIPIGYDDWMDFDIADLDLIAGTYGLAGKHMFDGIRSCFVYDALANGGVADTNLPPTSLLPNPFVVDVNENRQYSIYAEYTPSAPPPSATAGGGSMFFRSFFDEIVERAAEKAIMAGAVWLASEIRREIEKALNS